MDRGNVYIDPYSYSGLYFTGRLGAELHINEKVTPYIEVGFLGMISGPSRDQFCPFSLGILWRI